MSLGFRVGLECSVGSAENEEVVVGDLVVDTFHLVGVCRNPVEGAVQVAEVNVSVILL